MSQESPDIPHSMRKVYRRFERWRSAHTARLPIPKRLWAAAVELAREHGVSPNRAGSAFGIRQAETADGISESGGDVSDGQGPGSGAAPRTIHCAASVCGTDA